MSGLLFLLDIAALVLIAWWAYQADRPGGGVSTGILGMVDEGREAPLAKSSKRRWAGKSGYQVTTSRCPLPGRSAPRWRRGPDHHSG
jgi:hypothetical protein